MTDQQQVATRAAHPLVTLKNELDRRSESFKFALPSHISPEKFIRVVITAVQNSPDLQACTHQSIFNACLRAAQDGLLPDGKEGAIVPYADGQKEKAQWMPMIQGLRKLVMNAGVLSDWNVQVVQEGDEFDYQLGDNPFIHHKPSATGGRARKVLFAYSIATYPDGTKSREVMNGDQIADIMKLSKAKKGPWSNPVFYPEMARKTVARLHSKQLPKATDLLNPIFQREDEALAESNAQAAAHRNRIEDARRPVSIEQALEAFAAPEQPASPVGGTRHPVAATDDIGEEGGEQGSSSGASEPAAREATADPAAADETAAHLKLVEAFKRGQAAKSAGHQRKAIPPEYREADQTRAALCWQSGYDGGQMPEFNP
jgi:recombination protein RecT